MVQQESIDLMVCFSAILHEIKCGVWCWYGSYCHAQKYTMTRFYSPEKLLFLINVEDICHKHICRDMLKIKHVKA